MMDTIIKDRLIQFATKSDIPLSRSDFHNELVGNGGFYPTSVDRSLKALVTQGFLITFKCPCSRGLLYWKASNDKVSTFKYTFHHT